jgi:hypothetical protein
MLHSAWIHWGSTVPVLLSGGLSRKDSPALAKSAMGCFDRQTATVTATLEVVRKTTGE